VSGTGTLTRSDAVALDAADPLAAYRDRFVIDPDVVYLDGNSLGCLPAATVARLRHEIEDQWGQRAIRGWEEGWLELPVTVGERIARAALGCNPGQVVVGDSTTVSFFKLASAALDARPGRRQVVTDVDNFPTDRYVLESLARARGLEIVWLQFDPAAGPVAEEVAAVVGPDTALVTFSHVSYRSAFVADMPAVSAVAREAGALILWDLCHSAGSVPLELDAWGADLAVGCTYKYLNGGPGSPAFMYVRRELQDQLSQPIWGWLGRADPFEMAPGYLAAPGMGAFLSGSPPVLALSAVDEGVRLVEEAGIGAIHAKAMELTEHCAGLADAVLAEYGVHVASPRDPARRGAHLALAHADAFALCSALVARGVIPDFRRPDVIRYGFSPLTSRFVDVWDGIEALRALLAGEC
jgi:kynureninase